MKHFTNLQILLAVSTAWLGLFAVAANAKTLSFSNDGNSYNSYFSHSVSSSFTDHYDFYTPTISTPSSGGHKEGAAAVDFGSPTVYFDSYKLTDLDTHTTVYEGGSGHSSSFEFNVSDDSHHYQLDIGGHGDGGYDGKVCITPTSPVPEPETYAMLLAGMGLIGFAARRRSGLRSSSLMADMA